MNMDNVVVAKYKKTKELLVNITKQTGCVAGRGWEASVCG
jgi:hypothetical protein